MEIEWPYAIIDFIAFNPASKTFASLDDNGKLALWDISGLDYNLVKSRPYKNLHIQEHQNIQFNDLEDIPFTYITLFLDLSHISKKEIKDFPKLGRKILDYFENLPEYKICGQEITRATGTSLFLGCGGEKYSFDSSLDYDLFLNVISPMNGKTVTMVKLEIRGGETEKDEIAQNIYHTEYSKDLQEFLSSGLNKIAGQLGMIVPDFYIKKFWTSPSPFEKVLYMKIQKGNKDYLVSYDVISGKSKILPEKLLDYTFIFSPDGKYTALLKKGAGSYKIYLADTHGEIIKHLVTALSEIGGVMFSYDSQYIYYFTSSGRFNRVSLEGDEECIIDKNFSTRNISYKENGSDLIVFYEFLPLFIINPDKVTFDKVNTYSFMDIAPESFFSSKQNYNKGDGIYEHNRKTNKKTLLFNCCFKNSSFVSLPGLNRIFYEDINQRIIECDFNTGIRKTVVIDPAVFNE